MHLALPFIFVLKVHWLWQKAFQILPSSLYITFVSLQRTYRSEIVNLRSICGIAGERIQGSMRVSNAQRMTLLAPPHPPHPAHVEVCAAGMMHLWNCRRTYTRPACVWERKAHDVISPTPPHPPNNVQKTTKTHGRLRAVGQTTYTTGSYFIETFFCIIAWLSIKWFTPLWRRLCTYLHQHFLSGIPKSVKMVT